MAKLRTSVIDAVRRTAVALAERDDYQWGHMGTCNCGFLAQQVTHLRKDQIHTFAMERCGDWNEQLNDYCPTSGLAMDSLISNLLDFGFDIDDLKHLERLSDRAVLKELPEAERHLLFNSRKDLIKYLLTWAHALETRLLEHVTLPALLPEPVAI